MTRSGEIVNECSQHLSCTESQEIVPGHKSQIVSTSRGPIHVDSDDIIITVAWLWVGPLDQTTATTLYVSCDGFRSWQAHYSQIVPQSHSARTCRLFFVIE